jgi:hypothetical protein
MPQKGGGQFRQAGDWPQKRNPTLATDILQHFGHLSVQHVCPLDVVEHRLEQRESPE